MSRFGHLILLRLKLTYRSSETVFLTLVIVFFMSYIIMTLFENVEENTRIPVGWIVQPGGIFYERLYDKLEKNTLIELIEVKDNKGLQMLKDGEIEALFRVASDADERIWNHEFEKVIKVSYVAENYFPLMLNDIVAGEFLDEVCIRIAVKLHQQALALSAPDMSVYEQGERIAKEAKEFYYIAFTYKNNVDTKQSSNGQFDSSVIYKKMVIGILFAFIAFFTVFNGVSIVKDREVGLDCKLRITPFGNIQMLLADYLSVFISSMPLCVVLSVLCAIYDKSHNFWPYMGSCVLYVMSLAAIVVLLTRILYYVSSYIVVGSAMVIVMGIMSGSFFSIDLNNPWIMGMAKSLPAYYTMEVFLQLIATSKVGNMEAIGVYTMISTIVLWSVTWCLDKTSRFHKINI